VTDREKEFLLLLLKRATSCIWEKITARPLTGLGRSYYRTTLVQRLLREQLRKKVLILMTGSRR